MALSIDASIATPSANSYADLAWVNAYAQTAIDSDAWNLLDDTQVKILYILRARRLMDSRVYYPGRRVQYSQALEWPRIWVSHPSSGYYNTDIIPDAVKDAQSQLALYLAMTTTNTFGTLETSNFDHLKVGPIDITFSKNGSTEGMAYFANVIIPILETGKCVQVGARLTR